ncbi:MAG: chemotaxis protein CheC [Deltaproteobacteria bacterium]|nr:chemotaxis protein CheC [Deltaproteobacteria bacterium]
MTEETCAEILGNEEQDIPQEIMNIGFGSAAADLSGVIDLYVQLSVPTVKVIPATELIDYIRREVPNAYEISVIEQNFWSKFKGMALLVFSSGAGKALLGLLGDMDEQAFESDPMRVLEKETLMEVGNILVGACVGKVAELLGDAVSYSPPRILIGALSDTNVSRTIFDPGNCVIILQTVFHFGKQDVRGYLFLVASQDSFCWLRRALQAFMSQYE